MAADSFGQINKVNVVASANEKNLKNFEGSHGVWLSDDLYVLKCDTPLCKSTKSTKTAAEAAALKIDCNIWWLGCLSSCCLVWVTVTPSCYWCGCCWCCIQPNQKINVKNTKETYKNRRYVFCYFIQKIIHIYTF